MRLRITFFIAALLMIHLDGQSQTTLSQHINVDSGYSARGTCPTGSYIFYREYVLLEEGVNINEVSISGASFSILGHPQATPQNLVLEIYSVTESFPNNFPSNASLLGSAEIEVQILDDNEPTDFEILLPNSVTVSNTSTIVISLETEGSVNAHSIVFEEEQTKISWLTGECSGFEYAEDPNPGLNLSLILEQTLGIDNTDQLEISIYPNPVEDILRIDNSKGVDIIAMRLFNSKGQSFPISSNYYEIRTENLSSGLYFLRIQSDRGTIVKKFIKS